MPIFSIELVKRAYIVWYVQCCELADPESRAFSAPGSGIEKKIQIRDPGSVIRKPRSGTGINISDHISESSVTDPEWKNPDSGSGM
jgi:hypothetical protein